MVEPLSSKKPRKELPKKETNEPSSPPIVGPLKRTKELDLFHQGFDHFDEIKNILDDIKNTLSSEEKQQPQKQEIDLSLEEILEKIKDYHNQIINLKKQADDHISLIEQSISSLASETDIQRFNDILNTKIKHNLLLLKNILSDFFEVRGYFFNLVSSFERKINTDYQAYIDYSFLHEVNKQLENDQNKLKRNNSSYFGLGKLFSKRIKEEINQTQAEITHLASQREEIKRMINMYDEFDYFRSIPSLDYLLEGPEYQINKLQEAYINLFLNRSNQILSEFDDLIGDENYEENLSEDDRHGIGSYIKSIIPSASESDIEEIADLLISGFSYDSLPNVFKSNSYLIDRFLPWLRTRKKSIYYLFGTYKKITKNPSSFLDYLEFLKRCQHLIERANKTSSPLFQFYLSEREEDLQSRRKFFIYEFNIKFFKAFREHIKTDESRIFEKIDDEINNLILECLLASSPESDTSFWSSMEILFLPPQPIFITYLILNIFRDGRFRDNLFSPYSKETYEIFTRYISEILEQKAEELNKLEISGLIDACNILVRQNQEISNYIDDLKSLVVKICRDLIGKDNRVNTRKFIIESLRGTKSLEGDVFLLELLDTVSDDQEMSQIIDSLKTRIIYNFDKKILESIANIFKKDTTNTKKMIFRKIFDEGQQFFIGLIERREELKDFIKELYDIEDDITYEKFLETTLCFIEFSKNCDFSWSRDMDQIEF